MNDNLVIAIVYLIFSVAIGILAVNKFCDGRILLGIIEAVMCVINIGCTLLNYRKYKNRKK